MTWGFWRQDDDPNESPTFVFDNITREQLTLEANVTAHAVEKLGDVNLHVHEVPRRIELSGRMTPCVLGAAPEYSEARIVSAVGLIDEMRREGQPVVVVNSYWTRSDMVITRAVMSYAHNSGWLTMDIVLEQVSIVEPDIVEVPLARLRAGLNRRRGGEGKKGGGGKSEATDEDKKKSDAAWILRGIRFLGGNI